MVAPSLYPKPSIKSNRTIVSCNKCDICKNILITDRKFRCTVTGKTYFIKGNLPCDSCNLIYLITCSNCREQYVGSAINFEQRFKIHKSDIKTYKDRCDTTSHLNNKCCSPNNKHAYLKVQIIEQVFDNNRFSMGPYIYDIHEKCPIIPPPLPHFFVCPNVFELGKTLPAPGRRNLGYQPPNSPHPLIPFGILAKNYIGNRMKYTQCKGVIYNEKQHVKSSNMLTFLIRLLPIVRNCS